MLLFLSNPKQQWWQKIPEILDLDWNECCLQLPLSCFPVFCVNNRTTQMLNNLTLCLTTIYSLCSKATTIPTTLPRTTLPRTTVCIFHCHSTTSEFHALVNVICKFVSKTFLEDTNPFCGVTDILDFWWGLSWVSKLLIKSFKSTNPLHEKRQLKDLPIIVILLTKSCKSMNQLLKKDSWKIF